MHGQAMKEFAKKLIGLEDPQEIEGMLRKKFPMWKRLWWVWFIAGIFVAFLVFSMFVGAMVDDIFQGIFGGF